MTPSQEIAKQQAARSPRRDRGQSKRISSHRIVPHVIVVGAPGDVPRALEHPAVGGKPAEALTILAIDIESPEGQQAMDRLAELLRTRQTQGVLVAGPIGAATMRHVADLALLHGCPLLAVMPTEVLPEHSPTIVWSDNAPLVQLSPMPRRQAESQAKRVFDVVVALVGLIVTAPLLLLLALLVRLESPGAPVFRHERIGRGGRRFSCLKLRTMRADAEAYLRSDPELYEEYRRNHFKIPEHSDPRVTRLGRILRKTSLDELPQLWNVLVGDMSLVGPRPVVHEELDVYGPSKELLLSVRPGLTGAWAVNGRHDVGYPERCSIELEYVRQWNFVADLKIALRTVRVVTTFN